MDEAHEEVERDSATDSGALLASFLEAGGEEGDAVASTHVGEGSANSEANFEDFDCAFKFQAADGEGTTNEDVDSSKEDAKAQQGALAEKMTDEEANREALQSRFDRNKCLSRETCGVH